GRPGQRRRRGRPRSSGRSSAPPASATPTRSEGEPGGELERSQAGPVVEDLRGQNELVGARAIAQGPPPVATGGRRADGGAGEDPFELSGLGRREARGEAGDRRRERRR